MYQPPLRIVVLHHPASAKGKSLATHLYKEFMEVSGQPGIRIPVIFGTARPDGMPPEVKVHEGRDLIVLLVDERMARRVDAAATADAWGQLIFELLGSTRTGTLLPVALDAQAFDLDERLQTTSFARLDVKLPDEQPNELSWLVTTCALRLLLHRRIQADAKPRPPLEFFISHAKGDLPRDDPSTLAEGPVKALLAELAQREIDAWYDAKRIPIGGRFDDEILKGVLHCSAMVCVVTDQYSSREWCRREALEAKQVGRPMVVVDALAGEVPRVFPYLGNTPTIRWRSEADTRRVLTLAVREALRYEHSLALLGVRAIEGDWVLGTAPEVITLLSRPANTKRVVYPDPPLGSEELIHLAKVLPADVALTTPLSELARWQRPAGVDMIGLSLSNSSDADAYGMSGDHLATVANDLTLYVLLAGLRLAYGGMLGHAGDSGPNYVDRLFGLLRSYSPLIAKLRKGEGFSPIVNYVGWPIYHRYGEADYRIYGREALLKRVEPPPDLHSDEVGFFPCDTVERRFAWARSLTHMRERMQADITARIIMGGKLRGYSGLLPGVLEEALLSIRHTQPVYPIGAFGGATQLFIDAIEGRDRPELHTKWMQQNVPDYSAVVALYSKDKIHFDSPEAIAEELARRGRSGPAATLNNGLDDSTNRELFTCTDPFRIVELVLDGLRRWSEQHKTT